MKIPKKKNVLCACITLLMLYFIFLFLAFVLRNLAILGMVIIASPAISGIYLMFCLISGKNYVYFLMEKKIKINPFVKNGNKNNYDIKDFYEEYEEIIEHFLNMLWFPPEKNNNIFDDIVLKYQNSVKLPIRVLTEIVNRICSLMNLNRDILEVEYRKDNIYKTGQPGYFEPRGNIGGKISVLLNPHYTIYTYIAVLCHECCHYFMYVNNINDFYDISEEEFSTDIMTLYFGLFKYMEKGYSYFDVNGQFVHGNKELALGYVPCSHLKLIQDIIEEKKNSQLLYL